MTEWEKQAEILKEEADDLIKNLDLIEILSKYGEIDFTGSYHYDLLTRRDIDICLKIENATPEIAFNIGKEIAKLPLIGTILYRNEFILHTFGNPMAIFLCVEYNATPAKKWKIDILISNSSVVNQMLDERNEIIELLTSSNRNHILKIKSELSRNQECGGRYSSRDIYKAVLKNNVSTVNEFFEWWNKREKKRQYQSINIIKKYNERGKNIYIREATEEDQDQISKLYYSLYSDERNIESKSISFDKTNFENLLLIAELDNKLVGFIWGYFVALGIRRYGYVEDLFVEENYRNQGVATALLTTIKNKFIELNVEALFVTTEKENENAISLYLKEGFQSCPGPWFYWAPQEKKQ